MPITFTEAVFVLGSVVAEAQSSVLEALAFRCFSFLNDNFIANNLCMITIGYMVACFYKLTIFCTKWYFNDCVMRTYRFFLQGVNRANLVTIQPFSILHNHGKNIWVYRLTIKDTIYICHTYGIYNLMAVF